MKLAAFTTTMLLFAGTAFAGSEVVIRDTTTNVSVSLNAQTVKCSKADYAQPMLKVLIPALADLTVLNHRNTREGAPCVAAGPCRFAPRGQTPHSPDDVLKHGEGVETIAVRVVLKRLTEKDATVCQVTLKEEVFTIIRGIPFYHLQSQSLQERNPADCPGSSATPSTKLVQF